MVLYNKYTGMLAQKNDKLSSLCNLNFLSSLFNPVPISSKPIINGLLGKPKFMAEFNPLLSRRLIILFKSPG